MAYNRDVFTASIDTASVGSTVTAIQDLRVNYSKFYLRGGTVVESGDPTKDLTINVFGKDTIGTAYNTTGFLNTVTGTPVALPDATRYGFHFVFVDFIYMDADATDELHYTLKHASASTAKNIHIEWEIEADVESD